MTILVDSAIRSLAFAALAGLALRLGRVRDSGMRLAAWTGVLYGLFLLPLAGTLAPPLAVPVSHRMVAEPSVTILPATFRSAAGASASASLSSPSSRTARVNWRAAAAGIYLPVALLLLGRLGLALLITRRLRRACRPVNDSGALADLEQHARDLGIRKTPLLAESGAVAVPLTIGWLRPAIVLPACWREWDRAKTAAVLAHELSHVRRSDYGTLLLASIYRCLFWFNPLSWWLDRHLRELCEQASDDSALRTAANRAHYAEVVLGFFEAVESSRARVRWQGVAMARAGSAGRRIDRILAPNRKLSTPAGPLLIVGLTVLLLPFLYLSAAIQPVRKAVQVPLLLAQAASPTPPAAADPQAQPAAPQRTPAREKSRDAYVIVHGDSVTMSGSTEEIHRATSLRGKYGDEFLWFRLDGKDYVIRDPATFQAALKLFAPQEILGKRQEELGEMQSRLGALQSELGKKQGSARVSAPDLTRELEKLQDKLRSAGTAEELGEVQALLAELQAKIGDQQAKVSDLQAQLGAEQARLGDRQAQLGAQQAELGEEQAKQAEESFRELRILLEEALKKGLAEPDRR